MKIARREFLAAGSAATASNILLGSSDPIQSLKNRMSDLAPVPRSEYLDRLERARTLLVDNRCDALLLESGPSLQYFTGVQWGRSERTFGAVLPKRGQPVVVSPAFEKSRAEEALDPSIADLRVWQEDENPFEVLAGILRETGAASGRLAVEPTTRNFVVLGVGNELPAVEMADGRGISEGCRMVKSPLELAYLKRADEITKTAFRAAFHGLKEGMNAADLNERIAAAHDRMGVRGGALVLLGAASAFPHGTRDARPLRDGDVVLVDGGCRVHGYHSDVTRTTVFGGKASQKLRDVWGVVLDAQNAAYEAAGPGVPCEELDRVARATIDKAGFGPDYRYFTHRLGHGVGLEGHEAPYIVRRNRHPLQPGMTFSNEPGIYIAGEFGVRHEDILVITENGAEFLGERTRPGCCPGRRI